MCAPKRKQSDRSLFSIPAGLIKLQSLIELRNRFIKIAPLKTKTTQRQLCPCFSAARFVGLSKIERLFQILTGVVKFAARDKRITQIYQAVRRQVSNVISLRSSNRFERDLLGAFRIALGIVNAAQLQLDLHHLVLIVGAPGNFQRFLQLRFRLGQSSDLAEQRATLIEHLG